MRAARGPATVAALAACALGVPAATSAAPLDPDPPERLLVTAREFSLSLSKSKLRAGDAIVELYDYGEDPHDLRIQRAGGRTVFTIPEVLPGETGRVELRLRKRSRYHLWCSLANHAELGMRTSLRTSRK